MSFLEKSDFLFISSVLFDSRSWGWLLEQEHGPCWRIEKSFRNNIWKQLKCSSTGEWIKKMWCIYTMEYYLASNKNEIISFAAMWMHLEIIILNEVSQTKANII